LLSIPHQHRFALAAKSSSGTVMTTSPTTRMIVEFDCANCRYRVVHTHEGWVHVPTRHPSCGAGKVATPVGVRLPNTRE
jgi:hypothetical protein